MLKAQKAPEIDNELYTMQRHGYRVTFVLQRRSPGGGNSHSNILTGVIIDRYLQLNKPHKVAESGH